MHKESDPCHPPVASSSPASPTSLHTTCRPRSFHRAACACPSALQPQTPASLRRARSSTQLDPTPHTCPTYPATHKSEGPSSSALCLLPKSPHPPPPARYTSTAIPTHARAYR